jgi:hypothetical protein
MQSHSGIITAAQTTKSSNNETTNYRKPRRGARHAQHGSQTAATSQWSLGVNSIPYSALTSCKVFKVSKGFASKVFTCNGERWFKRCH